MRQELPPEDHDAALMLHVREGDIAAFETLVERWKTPVVHFIHKLLPDRE